MSRVKQRLDGRSKKRPGPEKQRSVIADAAVDLFAQRGSAAVSISEICGRADVGRQTFYRCFTDKDDLIAYVYQTAVNEHIENAVQHLPSGGLDAAGMSDVVSRAIDAILERHKLAQLIFIESSNPASPAFEITERSFEQAAVALQRWFATTVGEKPSKAYLKSVMAGTRWLVHDAIIAGLTPRAIAEAKRASLQLFEGMYLTVKKAGHLR